MYWRRQDLVISRVLKLRGQVLAVTIKVWADSARTNTPWRWYISYFLTRMWSVNLFFQCVCGLIWYWPTMLQAHGNGRLVVNLCPGQTGQQTSLTRMVVSSNPAWQYIAKMVRVHLVGVGTIILVMRYRRPLLCASQSISWLFWEECALSAYPPAS